jgi:hypothetical protein
MAATAYVCALDPVALSVLEARLGRARAAELTRTKARYCVVHRLVHATADRS